jgi:hypothetical protein
MQASLARFSLRLRFAPVTRAGLPPAVSRASAALSVQARSSTSSAKSTGHSSVGMMGVPAAEAVYPPLFSRRARRERLQAALDVVRAGGEFVLPRLSRARSLGRAVLS